MDTLVRIIGLGVVLAAVTLALGTIFGIHPTSAVSAAIGAAAPGMFVYGVVLAESEAEASGQAA
jgi:hypothetical protein